MIAALFARFAPHTVLVLLIALAGTWFYARHETARADTQAARATQWQSAATTMRKSYDLVSGALHEQNAAIAQGRAQKAQYDAAKDSAAKDATPTLGRLSEASSKIRAVQQTSATGCHTNDAATAYKGEF